MSWGGESFQNLDRIQYLLCHGSGFEFEGLQKSWGVSAELRIMVTQKPQVIEIFGAGQLFGQ